MTDWPDDVTQVYFGPGSAVSHLMNDTDLLGPVSPASCGRRPSLFGWYGTGCQAERDRAAKLPLCTGCQQLANHLALFDRPADDDDPGPICAGCGTRRPQKGHTLCTDCGGSLPLPDDRHSW